MGPKIHFVLWWKGQGWEVLFWSEDEAQAAQEYEKASKEKEGHVVLAASYFG